MFVGQCKGGRFVRQSDIRPAAVFFSEEALHRLGKRFRCCVDRAVFERNAELLRKGLVNLRRQAMCDRMAEHGELQRLGHAGAPAWCSIVSALMLSTYGKPLPCKQGRGGRGRILQPLTSGKSPCHTSNGHRSRMAKALNTASRSCGLHSRHCSTKPPWWGTGS